MQQSFVIPNTTFTFKLFSNLKSLKVSYGVMFSYSSHHNASTPGLAPVTEEELLKASQAELCEVIPACLEELELYYCRSSPSIVFSATSLFKEYMKIYGPKSPWYRIGLK